MAGTGFVTEPGFDRKHLDAHAVRADGPARFGLPPVVDYGNTEMIVGPLESIGIAAFASQEKSFEVREVVFLFELERGVFFF